MGKSRKLKPYDTCEIESSWEEILSKIMIETVFGDDFFQKRKRNICRIASKVLHIPSIEVSEYLDSAGIDVYDYLESDYSRVMSALARLNRSLLKEYFTNCSKRFLTLSDKERVSFLVFVRKFSKYEKPTSSWKGMDMSRIDFEFYLEMSALMYDDEYVRSYTPPHNLLYEIRRSNFYHMLRSNVRHHILRAARLTRNLATSFIYRYHLFATDPYIDNIRLIHNLKIPLFV